MEEVMTMSTLTRWDPLGLDLPAWMSRLFDDRSPLTLDTIRIEEYIEDGTLVVRAEMPDVDIDKDVDISVHDGLLHIKAERSHREEEKERTFYRSEFRYGAFERTIPLPSGATVDDVKATYENGVLEIRMPTTTKTEPTKVSVQRVG
jgi:HSP20 family protein